MYLGRVVAIGKTKSGQNYAVYGLFSKSKPHRHLETESGKLKVVMDSGFEAEAEELTVYTAMVSAGSSLVVGNGSHVVETQRLMDQDYPPKKAIKEVLARLGPEPNSQKTPRITGVISLSGGRGWLGIVSKDQFEVRSFNLEPCQYVFVETEMGLKSPEIDGYLDSEDPGQIAEVFAKTRDFEGFLGCAAAVAKENRFVIAVYSPTTD